MIEIQEIVKENADEQDLREFVVLMQEVAELPKAQQDKVNYFTQGVIAAASTTKKESEQKVNV